MPRSTWKKFQQGLDPKRLLFLDESGRKTNMTRLYGPSFYGKRCYDSAANGHWASVKILSSIGLDGRMECVVFDGAVDRKICNEYAKNILSLSLRENDIVVMDNLSAHKSAKAYTEIRKKSAEYLFLPVYRPDLNPIEKMWSKIKQTLRGIKARTSEELFAGVGKALGLVSTHDAQGWFKSCR